jgi:hypothetical protein
LNIFGSKAPLDIQRTWATSHTARRWNICLGIA